MTLYLLRAIAKTAPIALAAALAACTAATADGPPPPHVGPPPPYAMPAPVPPRDPAEPSWPGEMTKVLSQADADRLLANKGLTLQWIDWNTRGTATVTPGDPLWTLKGAQRAKDGKGRLTLDGAILEVGEGYFTFRGRIAITDTPDPGRTCDVTKTWHFAITQNRPYYRLREFEWCDGLTDYVDLYF